jgi:hypothetical protein
LLSVRVGEQALDRERVYTLATTPFLAAGKEGFDALRNAETAVDEEDSISIPTLLRQHCTKLRVAKAFTSSVSSRAFPTATTAATADSSDTASSSSPTVDRLVRSAFRKNPFTLAPVVEGRVVCVE